MADETAAATTEVPTGDDWVVTSLYDDYVIFKNMKTQQHVTVTRKQYNEAQAKKKAANV